MKINLTFITEKITFESNNLFPNFNQNYSNNTYVLTPAQ